MCIRDRQPCWPMRDQLVQDSSQDSFVVGAGGSCTVPVAARLPVVVLGCVWEEQPGTWFPTAD
eukprot:9104702-Prorocentrum_lima.AAC.1